MLTSVFGNSSAAKQCEPIQSALPECACLMQDRTQRRLLVPGALFLPVPECHPRSCIKVDEFWLRSKMGDRRTSMPQVRQESEALRVLRVTCGCCGWGKLSSTLDSCAALHSSTAWRRPSTPEEHKAVSRLHKQKQHALLRLQAAHMLCAFRSYYWAPIDMRQLRLLWWPNITRLLWCPNFTRLHPPGSSLLAK